MLREQLEAGTKARTAIVKERDEARRRAEGQDQTIVKLVQDRLQLKQQVGEERRSGQVWCELEIGGWRRRLQLHFSNETATLMSCTLQVEGMTAKARTESDELRRVRTQKERLEGLCRTLQAELKAFKAGGSAAPAPADAGAQEGGSSPAAAEGAGSAAAASGDAAGPKAPAGAEDAAGSGAGGSAAAAAESSVVAAKEGGTERAVDEAPKADVVSALPSDLY